MVTLDLLRAVNCPGGAFLTVWAMYAYGMHHDSDEGAEVVTRDLQHRVAGLLDGAKLNHGSHPL